VSSAGAGRPAERPVRPLLSVTQLLADKKARPLRSLDELTADTFDSDKELEEFLAQNYADRHCGFS
jgi:hypothetical protein